MTKKNCHQTMASTDEAKAIENARLVVESLF